MGLTTVQRYCAACDKPKKILHLTHIRLLELRSYSNIQILMIIFIHQRCHAAATLKIIKCKPAQIYDRFWPNSAFSTVIWNFENLRWQPSWQEALLWQRDCATCLSVEILQLLYKTSHLKTRVPGLSCVIICVILRLAFFTQYLSVTDTQAQTDRRTDRYTTTAYIASHGKNRP